MMECEAEEEAKCEAEEKAKRAAEEKLECMAEGEAKRAGEHEMQVSLGGKSGDGVRAAASEDAGTSPASSQVLFSTVPIVTRCELIVHACAH